MVRQRLATIEQKPKRVIVAPTWRDPAGIASNPAFAKVLAHIRTCIQNGTPLPSTYYSKGAGKQLDLLLRAYGIMHLHLGKWNTRELLWIVQYPERVVFLELSDHAPFATRPPGALLHNYHRKSIDSADAVVATPVPTIKLKPRNKE